MEKNTFKLDLKWLNIVWCFHELDKLLPIKRLLNAWMQHNGEKSPVFYFFVLTLRLNSLFLVKLNLLQRKEQNTLDKHIYVARYALFIITTLP